MTSTSWRERLQTVLQYLLPQHLLSAGIYRLTRCRWKPLKNLLIRSVIRHYRVDMDLAAQADYRLYQSFNDFFTRQLKAGARPIAGGAAAVVCPVDGAISQIGDIQDTGIFQAKGHTFDLAGLMTGEEQLVTSFRNGKFITLYLSPRDYHRIHMPLSGQLIQMIYVPGRLFSVNRATSRCNVGVTGRPAGAQSPNSGPLPSGVLGFWSQTSPMLSPSLSFWLLGPMIVSSEVL